MRSWTMSKEQAGDISLWVTESSMTQPLVSHSYLFPVKPDTWLEGVLESHCPPVGKACGPYPGNGVAQEVPA